MWLTIPQPSWDIFKYGNTSDGGYLSLFTGGSYTPQWKYTDAPDADARAIQALYWAQQYGAGNSTVTVIAPAGRPELGDYLRYSFFDKYFKEQGCQSTSCPVENGTKNSSAYLLSWYYAWGGAVPADGSWAWRIGSSDVHFGYQNPLAAYALSNDTSLIPKSPTAKADWTTALRTHSGILPLAAIVRMAPLQAAQPIAGAAAATQPILPPLGAASMRFLQRELPPSTACRTSSRRRTAIRPATSGLVCRHGRWNAWPSTTT